jgi:hypothetical protein
MNEEDKKLNALTPVDGFSDTGDTTASPIRGIGVRFKEGKEGEEYIAYSEPFPVKDRTFAAIDKADGWQKLAEGVPPEYLMRKPGQARPPRPHVDEKDWPLDPNDKPEHPWKLTRYLYLLDTDTGEVVTFWSNTVGGRMAFDALSEQVDIMRSMHPGKIPVAIIALERTMFMTSFGSRKARPHFKIIGYKLRSQISTQNLLTDETNKIDRPPPTLAEELNDDLPGDLAAPSPENKPTKAPAPAARPTDRRELKKPRAKTAARSPSRQRLNNMDAG